MKTKLFLIMVLVIQFCWPAQAQKKAEKPVKLLYVVDAQTNYLIPYIENKLRNLSFADNDAMRMFDPVISFNSIFDQAATTAKIVHNVIKFEHLEDVTTVLAEDTKESKRIANEIISADLVLRIKINTFNGLIEFQFSLYSSTKKLKPRLLEYIKSASVFLDPTRSDYDEDLVNTLKQVFISAHASPVFVIKPNKSKIGLVYYYTDADTIFLEPKVEKQEAKDVDFKYDWEQTASNDHPLLLDQFGKKQTIPHPFPGRYEVSLKIYDGVKDSPLEKVIIDVVRKPAIRFKKNQDFSSLGDRIVIQDFLFNTHQTILVPSVYIKADITKQRPSDSVLLVTSLFRKSGKKVFDDNDYFRGDSITINLDRFAKNDGFFVDLNDKYVKSKVETITLRSSIDTLRAGEYRLDFYALYNHIGSNTLSQDFKVYERTGISVYVNYLFFPVHKLSVMDSWLNFEAGPSFNLYRGVSLVLAPGLNVVSQTSQVLYGDILLNLEEPEKGFCGGYSLLIYKNPQSLKIGSSLGLNMGYQFDISRVSLKFGATEYYSFNRFAADRSRFPLSLNYGGIYYVDRKMR